MSMGSFAPGPPGPPPNPLYRLGNALRTRFGTAPTEPDLEQISRIIVDIEGVRRSRVPGLSDWRDSVTRHCPSAGSHIYPLTDNSDLNELLEEIRRRLNQP